MISALGKTGLLVSFSISPKMWSGWKCEIRIVSIEAETVRTSRIK
jgi:hypothetical protein